MKPLNISFWSLTMFFLFIVTNSFGQQTYNPKALIPLDPAYKTGTLDNGIKYIIRGDLPEKKAYFYAFFNVGSIQEEPKEYGIAHLLEHLCFYGKSNFLKYFKANGMDMGEYINAGTAMERTQYTVFKVPVDKEDMIDSTLNFLKALSFSFNIKPEELEKERKVVLEEWRLRQNASARMSDKTEKLALNNSRYSRPSLLGDTAVINHCTLTEVRNFFNKWYRPDNLTILIIGDFETAKMASKVQQVFSPILKAEGKTPRVKYLIPDNREPIINIASDPEAAISEISIDYKHNLPKAYNQEQLRMEQIDRLIDNMFRNRLDNIVNSSNSPFLKASASYNSVYFNCPNYNEFSVHVQTYKNTKSALSSILTEMERINRYGFTNAELENIKNSWIKNNDPKKKEIKFPYSEYFVQCFYYILQGKTPPSLSYRRNFVSTVFPSITLQEVNKRFNTYIANIQPVISISCPKREKVTIPTIDEVKNILASVPAQKVEPYHYTVITATIFEKKVKPGAVIKQTSNQELGTTEWLLSNGVKVIIKPTDFKTDEIQFQATRKNDSLRMKDEYMSTGTYAARSIKKMGVDRFTENELNQKLSGKRVTVSPVASLWSPCITGNSTSKDLETALQLINLYCSDQRWDENVLMNELQRYKNNAIEKSSMSAFDDTIQKYWSYNVKNNKPKQSMDVNAVTLERLKNMHQTVFNDPAKLNFYFTGDIKPEMVKPLIEKYLGSLTAGKDSTSYKEIIDSAKYKKPLAKPDPWYETGRKSCEFIFPLQTPSASVYVCCQGKMKKDPINVIYGNIALSLMVKQCGDIIRGKYGASYDVRLFDRMVAEDAWQGHVYFQTDPKLAVQMKDIAMEEMKKFMEGNISEEDFNVSKTKLITKRTDELKSNEWWTNTALPEYYAKKNNIVPGYLDEAKNITLEGLKAFTKSIYEQGNIIDIVMKSQ